MLISSMLFAWGKSVLTPCNIAFIRVGRMTVYEKIFCRIIHCSIMHCSYCSRLRRGRKRPLLYTRFNGLGRKRRKRSGTKDFGVLENKCTGLGGRAVYASKAFHDLPSWRNNGRTDRGLQELGYRYCFLQRSELTKRTGWNPSTRKGFSMIFRKIHTGSTGSRPGRSPRGYSAQTAG